MKIDNGRKSNAPASICFYSLPINDMLNIFEWLLIKDIKN